MDKVPQVKRQQRAAHAGRSTSENRGGASTMGEIQSADSKARANAVAIVVVGAVLGGATLLLLQFQRDDLVAWFVESPLRLEASILGGVVTLIVLPLLLASAWVWRLGGRVLEEGRFPPQGLKVVRDTVVFRGAQAQLRGRLLQGLGVVFVAAGGVMLWLALRLVSLIQQ